MSVLYITVYDIPNPMSDDFLHLKLGPEFFLPVILSLSVRSIFLTVLVSISPIFGSLTNSCLHQS